MMMRVMLATALALGLGATAIAMLPQAPGERVASRAEMLAAQPRVVPASLSACAPAAPAEVHI